MACANTLANPSKEEDRLSPLPWSGPPPIFCLSDALRIKIPFKHYMQGIMKFDNDMQTLNESGPCCVPLSIAATMIILLKKHENELCHGIRHSFLRKLDFPYTPASSCEMTMDQIANYLIYEAECYEDIEKKLENYSTRYVFDALVELIQRCDNLRVQFSASSLKYMSELSLITELNKQEGSVCPEEESVFQERIMNIQVENMLFKSKIVNFIHYEFNKDLKLVENPLIAITFRFIIVNFIKLLQQYYQLAVVSSLVSDDKNLLINYTNVHRESMLPILNVITCKLARYLICMSPTFYECYYCEHGNSYAGIYDVVPRALINILLLNNLKAWYHQPCLSEYVEHSVPGCNFDNPECSCYLLVTAYSLPGCRPEDQF